MLKTETKRRIDTASDIFVIKVLDPKSQIEEMTIHLFAPAETGTLQL